MGVDSYVFMYYIVFAKTSKTDRNRENMKKQKHRQLEILGLDDLTPYQLGVKSFHDDTIKNPYVVGSDDWYEFQRGMNETFTEVNDPSNR